MRGHIFLLIGPSGSGKTTLIQEVRKVEPAVRFIPTTTTRKPRPGEQHGREYFFASDEEFDALIACGDLLEWQWVHGNRYGTSRQRFEEAIEGGVLGITSIDVLGGIAVKAAFPENSTSIFVRPSSPEELRRRLVARGDTPGEDLERGLERVEMEVGQQSRCDAVVTNDNGQLAAALAQLLDIMQPHLAESR